MSEWLLPLASLGLACLLGAMSPGPAFVLVLRTALFHGRPAAWAPIAGLAAGAAAWAVAALWGLQSLFAAMPWIARVLPLAGGAFLVHLAWLVWRAAPSPPPSAEGAAAPRSGFAQALLLQVSNPKVMVFFGSLFMAVLPPRLPTAAGLVVVAMIVAIEFGWYGAVAAVFGSPTARAAYGRAKAWIDRAMALLLAALGARLLLSPLLG